MFTFLTRTLRHMTPVAMAAVVTSVATVQENTAASKPDQPTPSAPAAPIMAAAAAPSSLSSHAAGKNCRVCSDAPNALQSMMSFYNTSKPAAPANTAAATAAAGPAAPAAAAAWPAAADGSAAREPCPPTYRELGNATWLYLHTMAAYYPEAPTPELEQSMLPFMRTFAQVYPCESCRDHMLEYVEQHPPQAANNAELSLWLCRFHNDVNLQIGKVRARFIRHISLVSLLL